MATLEKTKSCRIKASIIVLTLLSGMPAVSLAEDFGEIERFVDLMNKFFLLMDSMYVAASNPEHATLIQMNSLEDIYKEKGDLAAMVPVYRDIVQKSENPVVRRMARMRLADALKETGQSSAAIEVLRESIDDTIDEANRRKN